MFGLSFANPLMLYGLVAALLPVLIHLLNRRRSVTVSFSNVALLQTLQQDRMRRVRLKQWILLALRTALIALLVLAFARPTIRKSSFGGGHGESATVMLLDQSLSMGYESGGASLLSQAKRRVGEALAFFDEQDDLSLITFDDRANVFGDLAPNRAKLILSGVETTFRNTNPVVALDAARQLVRGSLSLNREVFIFSDLTRSAWEEIQEPYDGFEGSVVYVVRPPYHEAGNIGVRSVRASGFLLSAGERGRVIGEIENFGESAVSDVPVHAYVDDQRIGQKLIDIGAGERKRVQFPFAPDRSGNRVFRIEVPDDPLDTDNSRSSIVHIPDKLRIGVVGEPNDRYFAMQALSSVGGAALEVVAFDPGAVDSDGYARLDVLILCNIERLGRAEVTTIARSVFRGTGLLMLLGDGVDVRAYNEQVLPALCPVAITGIAGSRTDRERFTTFAADQSDHPVLRDLLDDVRVDPKFFLNYTIQPSSKIQVHLSLSDGSPVLVEHLLGNGRVMMMTSSADLAWSDLPVSGFFAPFLHRAARYLSTGSYGQEAVTVGQRVTRAIRNPDGRDAVVKPPHGPLQTVWAQQRGDQSHWVIDEVEIPGVWDIYSRDRIVDRFAVQIDSDEGSLQSVDDQLFRDLFSGAEVVFVEPDQDLETLVGQYRYGSELWRMFLFAALVCVAIELYLMSGEKRERG